MAEKNRLNVLVIDRDEATVLEVKDFLAQEGFRVQVATDPAGILDEVKQGKYQLVLLDVSPPADPAIELLEQIRAADSDLCVVAMTARPTVEVAVRALKRQAFDYLEKPLAMEELRAVIEAAIREKGLLIDVETRLNQIVGASACASAARARALTLKQLANRTGLSVSLISQIELGKSAASMSTLYKLATALQVKMTYFFETVCKRAKPGAQRAEAERRSEDGNPARRRGLRVCWRPSPREVWRALRRGSEALPGPVGAGGHGARRRGRARRGRSARDRAPRAPGRLRRGRRVRGRHHRRVGQGRQRRAPARRAGLRRGGGQGQRRGADRRGGRAVEAWAGVTAPSRGETLENLDFAIACGADAAVIAPLSIENVSDPVRFVARDVSDLLDARTRRIPVYLYDNADIAIDPKVPHIRTRQVKAMSRLDFVRGIKVSASRRVLGNYTKAAAGFRERGEFGIYVGNAMLIFDLFRPRRGWLGTIAEHWQRYRLRGGIPIGVVCGPGESRCRASGRAPGR